jgi:transposase
LVLADSTTCKAHRSAAGAAHSSPDAESLGRSRGGIGSKIHACTDRFGRILRLIDSPGQHSDLRHVRPLLADIAAKDAALDRGYVSARLRADLAAQGCTVHTPPKQGMLNPPPWDKAIYAQRHHGENTFSRLKDNARIALRRDKTRRSWMGFVYLAAAMINLRLSRFSHTA